MLDPEEEKANLESTSNFVNVDLKVKPRALIIDGGSLIYIMADPNAKALLLMFSEKCKAVVCCRVSPDQKREIVDLVRYGVEGVRTLAIGDGANDVAMIQAAHVGVSVLSCHWISYDHFIISLLQRLELKVKKVCKQ